MIVQQNVLFLTARPPWPLDTGAKIRAYHILEGMSRDHQVTLLTLYGDRQDETALAALSRLPIKVKAVYAPKIDAKLGVVALLKNLLSPLPISVQKYQDGNFLQALHELVAQGFDAIHCEHLHVTPYLSKTKTICIKGLDAHNVESQIAQRMWQQEKSLLRKALLWWNFRKMQAFETQTVRKMDYVFAVSELDRSVLAAMNPAPMRVVTVENGVDTTYFSPAPPSDERSLVFVGSIDWEPNADAIRYFVASIYPLIKRAIPEIRLTVVGRRPPEDIIAMAKQDASMTVTGTVDDVRPYVRKAGLVVVPIRFGGGTRLKVLEAFAMGKAVVSTSLGSEGIAYIDGENILIADSSADFAAMVVRGLNDDALRRKVGAAALTLAQTNYSWQTIQKKIRMTAE